MVQNPFHVLDDKQNDMELRSADVARARYHWRSILFKQTYSSAAAFEVCALGAPKFVFPWETF